MTHLVNTDQMFSAAGYISREYGDHGYRLGVEATSWAGSAIFLVHHSDGSEFRILVDRYGNVSRPDQCFRGGIGCAETDLMHECD